MAQFEDNNLQVIEYGYSILTYATRYDKSWIQLVEKLRVMIQANRRRCCCLPTKVEYFPEETVRKVMEYLDDKDLRKISVVNSRWNALSCEDDLWSNLLLTRFGVDNSSIKITNQSDECCPPPPKVLYKEMFLSWCNVLRLMEGQKFRPELFSVPSYHFQYAIFA